MTFMYFVPTDIKSIKNSFFNAGGVHQAKKIDCLCSDGIIRSLLLKVK